MAQNKWSKNELKASVEAYFDMLKKVKNNEGFKKSEYYQDLSDRFGRSVKAYGYRMSNISSVLALQGRNYLPGLKPLSNVGSNVVAELEAIIAEIEGTEVNPQIEFESKFIEIYTKKQKEKPAGANKPKSYQVTTTQYYTSPGVKAWVLKLANEKCELCKGKAPFITNQDIGYFELHHVVRLADGGSDTVENTVALCPNCHREMHFGKNNIEKTKTLYKNVKRLIKE